MNDIKDVGFFKGGKAIFTVANGKGDHYTFRINTPKGDKGDRVPYFVSLLTGCDNNRDYTYMGVFNPLLANVYLTAKSKYAEDTVPVKVIRWAIKAVAEKKVLPDGYTIQHEGKCCRCGRKLTTPDSIENGIGPECIKMV